MPDSFRRKSRMTTGWAALAALLLFGPFGTCLVHATDVVPSKVVHAGTTGDFAEFRKILASPTINTPKPFRGFGGWCGWPDVCRLMNGDLYVTFCAGYYHASWPTPLDLPPEERARDDYREAYGFLLEWDCPTGGQIVSIRSRDDGKTWSRPKFAFPVVPGAYYASDVIQLRDGTMLAAAYIQKSIGYWKKMPATPLEFAQRSVNRLPEQNVVFRSEDDGESWHEVSRLSFLGRLDAVYSFCEAPDGSVLAIYNVSPIPGGPGWPKPANSAFHTRWLTAVARSRDKGASWETLSVAGNNDFDATESTGGYLPDGSIGFVTRPTSDWFRSLDHGRTWSKPRQIFPGGKAVDFRRGSLQVLPGGVVAIVYCAIGGGDGQVIYSRDNGKCWIKPAKDRGFKYDPIAYYPDACVLDDGSIFAVGVREGLGKNEFGPHGAEVSAMRFRIKTSREGEGIELLPIGGPAAE